MSNKQKANIKLAETKALSTKYKSLDTILVERRDRVGLITLNRPKSLNALNIQLARELVQTLKDFDTDDRIGSVVVTGSPRAFAAGADIEEMADKTLVELLQNDIFSDWDQMRFIKKPVIAAVSGYALGGGFELAMLCDTIIASEDAQFGLPEIKLGILPGIGAQDAPFGRGVPLLSTAYPHLFPQLIHTFIHRIPGVIHIISTAYTFARRNDPIS